LQIEPLGRPRFCGAAGDEGSSAAMTDARRVRLLKEARHG